MRRPWAATAVVAFLLAGLVSAPAAQASPPTTTPDTVMVTYTSSVVVLPNVVSGEAGDTFTFINNRNNDAGLSYVSIVDASGSVSVDGTPCTTETSCKVFDKLTMPMNSVTVTVVTPGTTTIRRNLRGTWSTVGTLTISGSGGGSVVPAAPAQPSFTLTYGGNGGACVTTTSGSVVTGTWIALPLDGNCTRAGYTLVGFSTSPTNEPGSIFIREGGSTVVTGDNTLYAQWKVRVAADSTANECPGAAVTDVDPGQPVVLPVSKVCGDKILIGWAIDPGLGSPIVYQPGQSVNPTTNLTVFGVWAPVRRVGLTCSIVPEAEVDIAPVADGRPLTLPLTCGGRPVSAWTTNADGSGTTYTAGSTVTPSADIVLYASANGGTVTVTWHGNEGSCPDPTTSLPWGSTFAPANCTRKDYTATDWTTSADAGGRSLLDTALRDDVDAYPLWTKTPVVSVAWVYGCPAVTKQAASWNGATNTFEVTLPAAAGCSNPPYSLLTWNTAVDGSGDSAEPGATVTVSEDTSYYAQWGVPITFDYNVGDNPAHCPTVVVFEPFGKKFALPNTASCSRPNYLLGNWATMATWKLGVDPHLVEPGTSTVALVPVTFYAWWAPPIDVVFDANGGTCSTTTKVVANLGLLTLPAADTCTKPDHRLVGWAPKAPAPATLKPGQQVFAFSADASSVTYVAQWVSTSHCSAAAAPGVDWHDCDKSGAALSGAKLSGANLADTVFDGAQLDGADLRTAKLAGTSMIGTNLRNADLSPSLCADCSFELMNLTGVNLSGADLSGATLPHVWLSGADLSGASLKGAHLARTDLAKANLNGVNASGADIAFADLTGATMLWTDLRGTVLVGAALRDVNLSQSLLSGANFTGADLPGVNFFGRDLSNVTFAQANLDHANLSGTHGSDVSMAAAHGGGADLSNAKLGKVDLSGAEMAALNASHANLAKANLSGGLFPGAIFTGAKLTGASFSTSTLTDASFDSTNLSDVNFAGANVSESTFAGTTIGSGNFAGANVGGVDWSGKDLSSANLWKATLVKTNMANANLTGRDLTGVDLAYANLSNSNFNGAYTAKIGHGCAWEGYYRNSQVIITQPIRNLPTVVWKDGQTHQWGTDGIYFMIYCAA